MAGCEGTHIFFRYLLATQGVRAMDSEPEGTGDPGPRQPRQRSPRQAFAGRRLPAVAGAVAVVSLVAVAVLATALATGSPAPSAQAARPSATPAQSPTLSATGIYQRVAPSVVLIRTSHDLGTGVIISDDGTIMTADHVVASGGEITVTYADGTKSSAVVESVNVTADIATLKPQKLPSVVVPADLGGNAEVGEPVVAIGNPLGLTDSVSAGVVSGLDRSASTDAGKRSGLIQFDAAVNPGSSGGPLLDSHGLVIGIVDAIAVPDGQDAFAGIGFAVPIATALAGNGTGPGPQL